MNNAKDIFSTFLHLRDAERIDEIAVSQSFWTDLAHNAFPQLEQGRLMSAFTFNEPWTTWERHPAGEELILLISGSATIVFEESEIERSVTLSTPGAFFLVPKNVWHTARTSVPTSLLFLTPGVGTEQRPVAG